LPSHLSFFFPCPSFFLASELPTGAVFCETLS
jgi:hypothetical protein